MKSHLSRIIFFLGCLGAGGSYAQSALPNASTAMPILSTGFGARAVGMGESFTAVADDFSAIHYNPAGLTQLKSPELTGSHYSYLADGFYEMLGGAYPIMEGGTLGLAFHYLNYGSIDRRDVLGASHGSYSPFDLGAQCAFGFALDKTISWGLSSEWARQDIDGNDHASLAWGTGVLLKPSSRFSLGAHLRVLGLESGAYNLPAELSFGAALRPMLSTDDIHTLTISAGGVVALQDVSHLNVGFEYGFEKSYFVRGGYSADLADNQLGGVKGLDFGAGIKMGRVQLDYAFSSTGDLGNVQRFSLSLWFPALEKPSPPAESGFPMNPPVFENGDLVPPAGEAKRPVILKFQVKPEEDLTAQELFDQAEAKQKAGLKKEAIDLYLKVIEKDPHLEKAWYSLGRLYFDKSLESYRKVLEMDPNNEKLREWLRHFNK